MKTRTLSSLGTRGFLVTAAAVVAFASVVMLAYADVVPTVTTNVLLTSNNNPVSTANIGTSVFATAQVASTSATTSPSGTVMFSRYDNTSCSGSPVTQSGVALVNGWATSSAGVVGASGLSYKTHYDGQSGIFSEVNSSCVSVVANAVSTSLSSSLSTSSVTVGSSVTQSATLNGATSNAGGTVAYKVYSNNSCTNLWGNAGSKTVTNGSFAASDPFLFDIAGSYWWQAVYSGDANNTQATSSCLSLVVNATTTTAAISGMVYNDANKNLSKDGSESGVSGLLVRLYGGANKTGGIINTTNTNGSGNYSFGNLANGTYSVELASNASWTQETVDYTSVVIAGGASVGSRDFAIFATPGSTTTPGNGTLSGTVYNDKNNSDTLDAGDVGLAGFTVNLYKNAGWWGKKGNNDVFKTTVSDANGNYSFSGLANGTYSVELIEQKKNGWLQSTDDFKSLSINNNALTNINFGNTVIATSSNNHGKDGKGNNGKHTGWQNFIDRFGHLPWGIMKKQ